MTQRNASAGSVLTLGMFDGLHRGHRALIERAVTLARREGIASAALTFSTHPLSVLRPELAPSLLTTADEKAEMLKGYGIDIVDMHPFTREVAQMPPEEYLSSIVCAHSPRHIVVGFNYTFGQGGRGNGALIRAMGERFRYRAWIIDPVVIDGTSVSSTAIRAALRQGRMLSANEMLGWTYSLPLDAIDPIKAVPADGDYPGLLEFGKQKAQSLLRLRDGKLLLPEPARREDLPGGSALFTGDRIS